MSGDGGAAEARGRVRRVERALEAIDGMPASQRERALEALQAVLELYGGCLERVLERLEAPDSTVRPADLARDELIGHLLMIHGLHPLGFVDPAEVPGGPGGPPLVKLEAGRNGAHR